MSTSSGSQTAARSIEAEAAIRRLVAAYAVAVLTHDTDLWLSLWAPPDDRSPDPLTLNADWAARVARRWGSLGTTVLHITTHLIESDGDGRARGTVFCTAELDREPQAIVRQSLVYSDRYVEHRGCWRFAARRHLLWYGREDANPRNAASAHWPAAQVGRGIKVGEELRAERGLAWSDDG